MIAAHFRFDRSVSTWLSLVSAMALLGSGSLARATDPLSTWSGSVSTAPNIDATNFYNSGVWNISVTPKPFMTASTLNYTNIGTMSSSIGWEFDWGPSGSGNAGPRSWSSSFLNDSLGTISTTSGLGSVYAQSEPVGYLLVSATNIVNKGILSADTYSEINLFGSTVNLSRSKMEIVPVVGSGSANDFVNGRFTPDTSIFDQYWGQTNIGNMVSSAIWNGTNAASAFFRAFAPCSPAPFQNLLGFVPNFSDSTTNASIGFIAVTNSAGLPAFVSFASNIVRQAVFIYTADTNISAQVRFSPSLIPTNLFRTVAVQLSSPYIDFATLATQTNSLYLVDTLASSTNGGVLPNLSPNPYAACSDTTYRPGNYVLSRVDLTGSFGFGLPGNGRPPARFLYQPDFTNDLVTAKYADYSAYVDNQALQMPNLAISNLPGRVYINANNLNLSQARIRAEGQVVIHASNLVSSAGAVVDCQNLSYNLGATNGNLNVTGLAQSSVKRLSGTVSCWSATWFNNQTFLITNNYTVTSNGVVQTPLTNNVTVGLYVLMIDASGLSTQTGVTVQDLVLHSTNIVVSDSVSVANTLLFDGQSLTLNGSLVLNGGFNNLNFLSAPPLQNWTYALAPTLRYFTNNGTLFIPNEAHFGDDGPTNYLVFINDGLIFSASEAINADYLLFSNGVSQTSSGNFNAVTKSGQLVAASIYSGRDIDFNATALSINLTLLSAQNVINFNVPGTLTDGGSPNLLFCQNGFNELTTPVAGNLLGTTITTVAYYGGAEVYHGWAGANQGSTVAGFTANAIGTLVLSPAGSTNTFEPLFEFHGTAGTADGNGMYVSNLDLSMLTDYANEIVIDPTLDIYFGSAILNTNVNTGSMSAAQFLDGQFGNHLHYVAGVPGTVKTGAGAAGNLYKLTASYSAISGNVQLTGNILPGQTNLIEASTDLRNWIPIHTNIGSYLNIGSTTVVDPNAQNYPARFYRVVPKP